MKWNTVINEEAQYAEITTFGIADKNSSLEMIKEILPILKQKNIIRVIVDYSHIDSVTGTITDIYYRPQNIGEEDGINKVKIALIIKNENEEHFKFLKVVFKNIGINMSIYYDKETALKSLIS